MSHQSLDRAGEVFDQVGSKLYVLACVLADDPELAEQLVIQAITAHDAGPCTVRELSAAVHVAWLSWGPFADRTDWRPDAASGHSTPARQMLHELHRLPDDQRAAIALCRYGAHTYREVAEHLGVTPAEVAAMLHDAMQQLGVDDQSPTIPATQLTA